MDRADRGFERFVLLHRMEALLRVFPPSWGRPVRVLEADARDASLVDAAPAGAHVVLADGAPREDGDLPGLGPTFTPWDPPFRDGTFHAVLAGPAVTRRAGARRDAALRGLLSLASGVLVLVLPPSGAVAEVAARGLREFLAARGGGDVPEEWRRAAALDGEPLTPDEIEAALEGSRCAIHYLPARDPVGGAIMRVLHHAAAELVHRAPLGALLDQLHNLVVTEGGPALTPLYQDMVLLFPGHRSLPRGVARALREETVHPVRPGSTDLGVLQLVLQLDELERERRGEGRPALEVVPRGGPRPVDLGPLLERLEGLEDAQGRLLDETGRALEASEVRELLHEELERLREGMGTRVDRGTEILTQALDRLDGLQDSLREVDAATRGAEAQTREATRTSRRELEARLERLQAAVARSGEDLAEKLARLGTRLEESEGWWRKRLHAVEARQEAALETVLGRIPPAVDLAPFEERLGSSIEGAAGRLGEEVRRGTTRLVGEVGELSTRLDQELQEVRDRLDREAERLGRVDETGLRAEQRLGTLEQDLRARDKEATARLEDLREAVEDGSGQVATKLGQLHAFARGGHEDLLRELAELGDRHGAGRAALERSLAELGGRVDEGRERTAGLLEYLRAGFLEEQRGLGQRVEDAATSLREEVLGVRAGLQDGVEALAVRLVEELERSREHSARGRDDLAAVLGTLDERVRAGHGRLARGQEEASARTREREAALHEALEGLAARLGDLREEDAAGREGLRGRLEEARAELHEVLEGLLSGQSRGLDAHDRQARALAELGARPTLDREGVARVVREEVRRVLAEAETPGPDVAEAPDEEGLEEAAATAALRRELEEAHAATRRMEEDQATLARDLEATRARLRDLEEGRRALAEQVELYQSLLSRNPLLKAYIQAKGGGLPGSDGEGGAEGEGPS